MPEKNSRVEIVAAAKQAYIDELKNLLAEESAELKELQGMDDLTWFDQQPAWRKKDALAGKASRRQDITITRSYIMDLRGDLNRVV